MSGYHSCIEVNMVFRKLSHVMPEKSVLSGPKTFILKGYKVLMCIFANCNGLTFFHSSLKGGCQGITLETIFVNMHEGSMVLSKSQLHTAVAHAICLQGNCQL